MLIWKIRPYLLKYLPKCLRSRSYSLQRYQHLWHWNSPAMFRCWESWFKMPRLAALGWRKAPTALCSCRTETARSLLWKYSPEVRTKKRQSKPSSMRVKCTPRRYLLTAVQIISSYLLLRWAVDLYPSLCLLVNTSLSTTTYWLLSLRKARY